ncbi:MAG: hypothetical protein QOK14_1341 [Frankiaceae bacterium]|nr:hypothetical protein [Frankiaceae bacterium]
MERLNPQPAADERTVLDEYLDYHRATLLLKSDGLDKLGLNARPAPSELTLGGLLKHLAYVEDFWIQVRFLGLPNPEPWASAPFDEDPDWELHSAVDDDPADLRALYVAACERSRQAVAEVPLDQLSVGLDREGRQWNLRRILVHLIEETARHNGHADFLREAIDGTVGD